VFAAVKLARYSALVTQNDDWSARVARLVAREIRRYREQEQPKVSVQRLADRTAELGMPIPRSVLANLESGRRETVSVAEVIVLAAALNVSPIELICPAGFDKQAEILPGRMVSPLAAVRWFTGELKLETAGNETKLHLAAADAQKSSTYLMEYHQDLINRLRTREYEMAMAQDRAHEAEVEVEVLSVMQAKAAADGTPDSELDKAVLDAKNKSAGASHEFNYRAGDVADWRGFIREPLRQTRAEMSRRGMLLPDLPTDIKLDSEIR
jgi:transcriptional regulator with XRE-family HTH domain